MECELNKPICKRKLLMKEGGPFEKKKGCPLAEPPKCPLAPPQCPLLGPPECPVAKACGSNGGQQCPLAEKGCPCDPNPPCPLAYEDDKIIDSELSKKPPRKRSCPAEFPVIQGCPNKTKSITKKNIEKITCPCPNALLKANQSKNIERPSERVEEASKKVKHRTKNEKQTRVANKDKNVGLLSSKSKCPQPYAIKKKGLNVPDCTLSSSRPLPCSECLGKLLDSTDKSQGCKLFDKECPYLKIMNMCEDTCLCEDVPKIESGPPCPFAPKPCPCCATVKCPMTRSPNCPIASPNPQISVKPPSCKCYCPPVPPPCSLDIPPLCKMHNNVCEPPPCPLQPPKCKCNNKKDDKCALVPSLYTSCPIQATGQTETCSQQTICQTTQTAQDCSQQKKKTDDCIEAPTLEVTPDILDSLNDTLHELNKLCTCIEPPAPQVVNMVPTSSSEKLSCGQTTGCNIIDQCPLECPAESPRTFHVPTCAKSKPACLEKFPESDKEGVKVCPFYPKCCPLGPCCPFPVETRKKTIQPINPSNISSGNKGGGDYGKCGKANNLKSEAGKKTNWEEKEGVKNMKEGNVSTKTTSASKCPLGDITGGKKVPCPFAPAPCPLDPIKPLFKEPKVCPFAPEPKCPAQPKPLCPPAPSCLMASPAPECPYAPPGCPLAPKKLCPADGSLNYDCPCPKPKPCCCNPCSPCPDTSLNCQCEQLINDTCSPPESGCGCPDLEAKCPCPALQSKSNCPCPSAENQNDCPSKKSSLKFTKDSTSSVKASTVPSSKLTKGSISSSKKAVSANFKTNPSSDTNGTSFTALRSSVNCSSNLTESNKEYSKPKNVASSDVRANPRTSYEDNKSKKHAYSPLKSEKSIPPANFNASNEGRINCFCKTDGYSNDNCSCQKKDNELFCPCGPPVTKQPEDSPQKNVNTIINQLRNTPRDIICPMKIPPCEQFPEGRCPMEDLGLCDCDYPCPPCLLQPQCGSTKAPPQYCSKPDCCMGLPLPPAKQDRRGFEDKPANYYKLVETKPGKEETKYRIEFLDEPPVQNPFGIPRERENPNWYIVKHGGAYEKCKKLAEKMKDKEPTAESGAQFRKKDNPMDPETKLILENKKSLGMEASSF